MNTISYKNLLFPVVPKTLMVYGAAGCGKTNVLNSIIMGLTKEIDCKDLKILYVDAKGINFVLQNVKCPCIEYVKLCGEVIDNENIEYVMSVLKDWSSSEMGYHSHCVVMLSDVRANKYLSKWFHTIMNAVKSTANVSLVVDDPCGIEDVYGYSLLNEFSCKLVGACSAQMSYKLLGDDSAAGMSIGDFILSIDGPVSGFEQRKAVSFEFIYDHELEEHLNKLSLQAAE